MRVLVDFGCMDDDVPNIVRDYLGDQYRPSSIMDFIYTIIFELMIYKGSRVELTNTAAIELNKRSIELLDEIELFTASAMIYEIIQCPEFWEVKQTVDSVVKSYGGVTYLTNHSASIKNRVFILEFEDGL